MANKTGIGAQPSNQDQSSLSNGLQPSGIAPPSNAQPPVQGGGNNGGSGNPFMPPSPGGSGGAGMPAGRVANPYASTPNPYTTKAPPIAINDANMARPAPAPQAPDMNNPFITRLPPPLTAGPGPVAAGGPPPGAGGPVGVQTPAPPMIDPKKLEQARGMRPDLPWNLLGPMLQHWTSMP